MDGVHIVRNVARLDVAVEADQNGCQADEAVQKCNQFGHFGHFYFLALWMPIAAPMSMAMIIQPSPWVLSEKTVTKRATAIPAIPE